MPGFNIAVPDSDVDAPPIHIHLDAKNIKELVGLEVGKGVRVVLSGVLEALGEEMYSGDLQGHLCLRAYRIEAKPVESAFAELVDD